MHYTKMTYGGSGGIAPLFLTFALDGGEWSATCPCHFTARERAPGTHWIGGWVGRKVGMYAVEKRNILHCQILNSHPAGSVTTVTELLQLQRNSLQGTKSLETLQVTQLRKDIPTFYGTQRFNIKTRAIHWSLS
jgi:hypothetical protein